MSTADDILTKLKENFEVPSGMAICVQAMNSMLGDNANNLEWIKENFSKLVEGIQAEAYRLYLAYEGPAAGHAIRVAFGGQLATGASADKLFKLIEKNFRSLDRFFLSLTNGRRPRAGKAFELVLKTLFDKLGYPYTPQPIINGQPDFLLPSVAHYRENAMDCIVFTVKRTLRERWRQITTEATQGHQFFLATIDEGIALRDLPELKRSRIYVVVPESIRAKCYSEQSNVISFESFFKHHLDPAMRRWRDTGTI